MSILQIESDIDFIMDSWTNLMYRQGYNNFVPREFFKERQYALIVNLLKRGARCYIACEKGNMEHPLGYICYETVKDLNVVHMLYVRQLFRRNGLGEKLMNRIYPELRKNSEILITQPTYIIKKKKAKEFNIIYLPHMLDDVLSQ